MARRVVQNANVTLFVEELYQAAIDGWSIDPQNPPCLYGFYYEAHVLKDEKTVEPPKPSRAEILGNARRAKAAKAEAKSEGPQEGQEQPSEPTSDVQ